MELGNAKANLHAILCTFEEENVYNLQKEDIEAIEVVLRELKIRKTMREAAYEEGFRAGYDKGEANGYMTGYTRAVKWCQYTLEEGK